MLCCVYMLLYCAMHNVYNITYIGGSNLKLLRQRAPNTFFQFRGRRGEGHLQVYAKDQAALKQAIDLLRPYK
jgi:hypothetical protein